MEQIELIELPPIVTIACSNNRLKQSGTRCYTLRCTIDQGPKFVGKRVSVTTGTRDLALAERVASLTLQCLKKGGFLTSGVKLKEGEE